MRARARVGTAGLVPERGRLCRGSIVTILAALFVLGFTAAPVSAKQTHLFEENFPPKFNSTNGIAIDQSGDRLLVIDDGAGTVSRWNADGTPANFSALGTNVIDAKGNGECATVPADCDQTPQNGFKFGIFPGEEQIAIDNSGTATDGDIYVTQGVSSPNALDIFAPSGKYLGQITGPGATKFTGELSPCGVAVDSAGSLFVAGGYESKIYKYVPQGSPHNPLANSDLVKTFTGVSVPCNLAAGMGSSAGSLFANRFFSFERNSVYRFNSGSGALEGVVDPGEDRTVAVDPVSGHIYAGRPQASTEVAPGEESQVVREYDGSGTLPAQLVSGFPSFAKGIAISASSGEVYVSNKGISVYGPLVVLPTVTSGGITVTSDSSATLKGTVDPDGVAIEECFFEYGLTQSYGQAAPCEAPNAAEVGAGHGPVPVHADLSGLEIETAYHYRLVAKNVNAGLYPKDPNGTVKGSDKAFKTPSKPAIKAEWATGVGTGEATLRSTINPENSETTYRFEWGPDASYGEETTDKVLAVGVDAEDHTVSVLVAGLTPGTIYHYRVYAENGVGVTEGSDRTLRTFNVPTALPPCPNADLRSGSAELLPDCRAYEMVSPVNKEGGEAGLPSSESNAGGASGSAQPRQSSPSGEAITYGSWTAFGKNPESAAGTSQYFSTRGVGGWSTDNINPRFEEGFLRGPFVGFSSDLSYGAIYAIEPELTEDAAVDVPNLYLRDNSSGDLSAIITAENQPEISPGVSFCALYGGASADSGRVFIAARGALMEGDPVADGFNLYEWSAGSPAGEALRLVSVLPDRTPAKPVPGSGFGAGSNGCQTTGNLLHGAVSADGSRAFWSSTTATGEALFLRINPDQPESARLHGAATGTGDLTGPASGVGNLIKTSPTVAKVEAKSGAFAVGQLISGEGIPAETTITKVETGKLTLSKAATITKSGVELTAAASATVSAVATSTGAFVVGQEVSAPGVAPGTKITAVEETSPGIFKLSLSEKALKSGSGVALSATSECTEAASKACTIFVAQQTSSGPTHYWAASTDGSKVLFGLDPDGSGSEPTGLYELEAVVEGGKPSTHLTLIATNPNGVVGASDDLSRVYFVSGLGLYVWEEGEGARFITTLPITDSSDWSDSPAIQTARVSPDGRHLAFLSSKSLTGYDNTDQSKAEADSEVFLYDLEAETLVCASCNPTGARPQGPSAVPSWNTSFEQPRYLSDDGDRLFFETFDALDLRDTNGKRDVYEFERQGAGSCDVESSSFSATSGGCLYLLSTGTSSDNSFFLDASSDGRDAFISTRQVLFPSDGDERFDVYDARAEGGFSYEPPVVCEGEGCRGEGTSPPPPSLPGSSALSAPPETREQRCKKGFVRKGSKCVKRPHRKHRKHRHRRAHANRGADR